MSYHAGYWARWAKEMDNATPTATDGARAEDVGHGDEPMDVDVDEGNMPLNAEMNDVPGSSAMCAHTNSRESDDEPGCSQNTLSHCKAKRKQLNTVKRRRVQSKHLKWTDVARQRYIHAQDQYGRGEGGGVT